MKDFTGLNVIIESMQEETKEASLSQPSQNTLMKDLLIPISIIIAGVLVGAGLYFGGSGTPAGIAVIEETEPVNPIDALVVKSGVNKDDFDKCFEAGETLPAVQEDIDNAIATGGRGTPWGIVIGPTGKKYPLNGALPQQAIEQMIDVAKSESGSSAGQSEEALALEKMSPVTSEDHIKGNMNAQVTIVEYSDYDCPFCTRFHTTMNAISKKYGDDLAWVYRHFPLEQLHPNAKAVAVASECVAKLGGNEAFWTFTDGYLSN